MLRRSLILALVLGVAVIGVTPDLLCAAMSSKAARCACCRERSSADGMHMSEGKTDSTAACATACTFFSAPLQASQHEQASAAIPQVIATGTTAWLKPAPVFRSAQATLVQDPSPPPLQPLLCTFLI